MEGTEQRSSIGLLDIPLEMRQQIYHSCLVRHSVIDVDYLSRDSDQFKGSKFEKLLTRDFSTGDSSSDTDTDGEVPEKSACEGHEIFQVEDADVDNEADIEGDLDNETDLDKEADLDNEDDLDDETDSVPSEFDWQNLEYYNSVEPKTNSLVLVCKRVSQEATDVLYGWNTFRCNLHLGGGDSLQSLFSEANRRKIRKLEVGLRSRGWFYQPGKMLHSGLWSPILEGLTHISILAQQPLSPKSSEEDMRGWNDWCGPILKFLASRLNGNCRIYIDVDEKEETSALVKQCFLGGYQKVPAEHGDIFFKRGHYASRSKRWLDDDSTGSEWGSSSSD